MAVLIIGLVVFLGVHSIALAAPAFRSRAIARLGEGAWKGLYALVAAVGLVLIVYGFHLAREAPVVLYSPPGWMRYVTFLLMLPVFPLVIAAYLPGRIKTAMKHPLLAAVKFWALAHLLANGMLADVLLFGAFLVWMRSDFAQAPAAAGSAHGPAEPLQRPDRGDRRSRPLRVLHHGGACVAFW